MAWVSGFCIFSGDGTVVTCCECERIRRHLVSQLVFGSVRCSGIQRHLNYLSLQSSVNNLMTENNAPSIRIKE